MKNIDKKIMLLFTLGLVFIAIIVNLVALVTGELTEYKNRILALGCMIVLFFYVFRDLLNYIAEEKQRVEQNKEQR